MVVMFAKDWPERPRINIGKEGATVYGYVFRHRRPRRQAFSKCVDGGSGRHRAVLRYPRDCPKTDLTDVGLAGLCILNFVAMALAWW